MGRPHLVVQLRRVLVVLHDDTLKLREGVASDGGTDVRCCNFGREVRDAGGDLGIERLRDGREFERGVGVGGGGVCCDGP